jgi:hypothetical protein
VMIRRLPFTKGVLTARHAMQTWIDSSARCRKEKSSSSVGCPSSGSRCLRSPRGRTCRRHAYGVATGYVQKGRARRKGEGHRADEPSFPAPAWPVGSPGLTDECPHGSHAGSVRGSCRSPMAVCRRRRFESFQG